ncbi:MAG: RNA pseudouridine synthase [Gammaproteobacteria bacterium]|nr:RNA pseudouridine synthase [Gammaproteobacteria bacterium]
MSEPANHVEVHVSIELPQETAVDALQRVTALPRQRIKLAMNRGAVWLTRGRNTRRLRRAKRALQPGDELHLYYDAKVLAEEPAEPALIADVGGYSVWNKPYGLRSQGSKWGDHCTVVRWAECNLQPERPAFTVHRLDRAANGLILIAHSKNVAAALSRLFRERNVDKHYRVTVQHDFSARPKPFRIEQPLDDKEAVSEFTFAEHVDGRDRSILDVRIETGRKHQIRRHLASLGHPVIGDRLYGSGGQDDVDLQLRACILRFHCPVGDKPVEYRLP